MLVLTRHVGQRIVVGENIELVVVRITGNKGRLGIAVFHDVRARRFEVEETAPVTALVGAVADATLFATETR